MKDINELVSIIVPVYNVEKYLDRCIESVVNQTYTNLEIVLVDDGSPDNCPRMCDEWAEKDSRIRVIHKENAGIGMARNSGMEIAAGEYWMFVDSDDYISNDAVEVLLKRIIADNSDMAVGKHCNLYEDGRVDDSYYNWIKDSILSKNDVFHQMGKDQRIAVVAWGKLYRRGLFDDIEYPALKCGEDLWVFPLILDQCRQISIVERMVYFYYQRRDSILHQLTEQAKLDDINAWLHFSRFFMDNGYREVSIKGYSHAVSKSIWLKNRKAAKVLFNSYFDRTENKRMIQNLRLKFQLKWICLNVPGSNYVLMALKAIKD